MTRPTLKLAALSALAAPCCFLLLSTLQAREARADILVGADLNGGVRLGEVSTDGLGLGANLRVGWQEDFIPLLRLAAELQLNYMGFSIEDLSTNAVDTAQSSREQLISPRAGVRVGTDLALFGVAAYSHVGYALGDANGLSLDAGLAADFTGLPFVNVGLHGGYNAIFIGSTTTTEVDPVNWIDIGVHVEVAF